MTRKRKWVLRLAAVAAAVLAVGGIWAALNVATVKAVYAARQLRGASSGDDRAKAADRLASLGDPGLKRLVEFIKAGDESCRVAAVGAIDRLLTGLPDGEQRAVTVAGQLLDAFPSCDPSGQRAVLELLPAVLKKTGNAHAARCKEAVAAGLKMSEPAARVLTTQLALHPDVKMRAEVLPLLAAPEAEVRRAALFAVAVAGEGEPLVGDEELFRYLHDPDEGVRRVCRDALVGRDRSEVEITLGRRLTDPDPLERLKLLMDLRYDDDVADPEPWLERLGRDPEPAVRAGATRVAVELAAERKLAQPGWVSRVADGDPHGTVRFVAGFFRRQGVVLVDRNVRPASVP